MSTDTTEALAVVNGSTAPDFAHLAAEAAAIEGGPPVAGTPEAAAAEVSLLTTTQHELHGALEMARMMVGPMFAWWPDFGQVWSDQTLNGIAAGGAAVMVKHGWSMGELFSEYGPYLALAGATLPPSLATWQVIKQRRVQLAQLDRQRQQGKVPDGGQQQAAH